VADLSAPYPYDQVVNLLEYAPYDLEVTLVERLVPSDEQTPHDPTPHPLTIVTLSPTLAAIEFFALPLLRDIS